MKSKNDNTPFSYVNSISKSKEYIMKDKNDDKYVPYIINRCLCRFIDCILYVNEVNRRKGLTNIKQYEYLLYKIIPAKRYKKWINNENINDDIKVIMEYYSYSINDAKQVFPLFTKEKIDLLREELKRGKEYNEYDK